VKLARVIGLEASVYLCELMNINEKATRKNKVSGNFFVLDRDYIQSRTTIDEKRQGELDTFLVGLGIIEKSKENDNHLYVNIPTIVDLMTSPDDSLMKEVKIQKSKTSKVSKKQAILNTLKSNIVTDNVDLVAAYSEWIDAIYEKDGYMHKSTVISAQNVIDNFSQRNLDVALKVLEIALINGYRDMTYAVNNYKRNYTEHYRMVTNPPVVKREEPRVTKRLSDEIF
jgi:hypothetical protein